MPRFFNITGPCRPDRHSMLPAEAHMPALDPGGLLFETRRRAPLMEGP